MDTRFLLAIPLCRSLALMFGAALCVACGGGGGGGGSSSSPPPSVALTGTAATGDAVADATLSIVCARGSAGATTNASGAFQATVTGDAPCVITATSGLTTLRSTAFAGGTFNITPETDLLLAYVAGQLGTAEAPLVAAFPSSVTYQQTLANVGLVQNAEAAVVQELEGHYDVTLTTQDFLTATIVIGQPGVDSDLKTLRMAGVIDANGQADPAALTLLTTLGSQNPLPSSASGASSTAGGATGGTVGVGTGDGGMM